MTAPSLILALTVLFIMALALIAAYYSHKR